MSWNVSVGGQVVERQFAEAYCWVLVLPVVALASTAATSYFLDNFSTAPWRWLPSALGASAPVLWIVARIAPGPLSLTLLKVHAALYTALVVVKITMVTHHHGSGFATLARLIHWFENIAILGGNAIAIMVAWRRSRVLSPGRKGPAFVYAGLTVFLLAGWYAGLQAWSSAFRPRLIAAAEAQALDRPYCIEADGRPARTADNLTGFGMRAHNDGGWTWNFHALLVIGEGTERTYLNWSYISGRFEPVTLHARFALHLDDRVTCKPAKHFALSLI
jgi:hypothetical protein